MIQTLLGIKKNMTSVYDARGRRVGATVLQVTPNYVTQIKNEETKDGYSAIQIGMGEKKSVRNPQIGHFKKAGVDKKLRWVRETKVTDTSDNQPGQELKVSQVFSTGDSVKVQGVSKGRGFQGGVKRYNFAGGPKTHGQSDRHRAPGSIGSGTTPGRVYKGKRMAGHYGVDTFTIRNLEVISVDSTQNLMTVKGSVPGFYGGMVTITKLGKMKGYTPPPAPEAPEEEEVVPSDVEQMNGGEEVSDETQTQVENAEVTEEAKEEADANS